MWNGLQDRRSRACKSLVFAKLFRILFDVAGSTLFSRVDNAYTLGFLASCVCFDILGILNPTLNYQAGNIKSLPLLIDREDEVDERVYQNIQISKDDWDSFENSWDFTRNPLV